MNRLEVFWADQKVGSLEEDEHGRFVFHYANEYRGPAVSHSLPVSPTPYTAAGHRFFANLLPEGDVRRAVTRRLGISEDNDIELMRAIGGECAGALAIVEEDRPSAQEGSYLPLDLAQLDALSGTSTAFSEIITERGQRLSLAGAQDKIPVFFDGESLFLPAGGAPSSHILKLENRDFKHLPANEVFTTDLARAVGLPVVETSLFHLPTATACLVQRYDRQPGATGCLQRLHQEDFCQALAKSSHTKYEDEGGPSFRECFELVRDLSVEPLVDTDLLLRWQLFNLLAGNSDGHGKNLSILYGPSGARLAPAYDLVSTRAYPGLSGNLAMGIGGQRDPGQVGAKNLDALARDLDMSHRLVNEVANELLTRLPDQLPATAERFRRAYGDSPILGIVTRVVRKQLRRTADLICS